MYDLTLPMGARVLTHLRNPHLPDYNKGKKERNIFVLLANGTILQFTDNASKRVGKIAPSHIPAWFRKKQLHGWIPVRISMKGEVIERHTERDCLCAAIHPRCKARA